MKPQVLDRPPTSISSEQLVRLQGELVTVRCGAAQVKDRLGGKTVARIRADFSGVLAVPPGAAALLEGRQVPSPEETQQIVGPGQHVEFVARPGPKG